MDTDNLPLYGQSVEFYKNYESLDSFGTEMSSRTRIKTRNWRNPSASYRYVQLSELNH